MGNFLKLWFLPEKSIAFNLLEGTCMVSHNFQKVYQTDVFYADFSKAFDNVYWALMSRYYTE